MIRPRSVHVVLGTCIFLFGLAIGIAPGPPTPISPASVYAQGEGCTFVDNYAVYGWTYFNCAGACTYSITKHYEWTTAVSDHTCDPTDSPRYFEVDATLCNAELSDGVLVLEAWHGSPGAIGSTLEESWIDGDDDDGDGTINGQIRSYCYTEENWPNYWRTKWYGAGVPSSYCFASHKWSSGCCSCNN